MSIGAAFPAIFTKEGDTSISGFPAQTKPERMSFQQERERAPCQDATSAGC